METIKEEVKGTFIRPITKPSLYQGFYSRLTTVSWHLNHSIRRLVTLCNWWPQYLNLRVENVVGMDCHSILSDRV